MFIFALGQTQLPNVEALVTARIYRAGNIPSFYRVYLWDLRHQKLKPITPDGIDVWFACWNGRNEILCFTETDHFKMYSFFRINLRGERLGYVTGVPQLNWNTRFSQITPQLNLRGKARIEYREDIYELRGSKFIKLGNIEKLSPQPDFKIENDGQRFRRGTIAIDIPDNQYLLDYMPGRTKEECFMRGAEPVRLRLRDGQSFWRIDWRKKKASCIIDACNYLDFVPQSPWWGGSTSSRSTADIGKRSVWIDWGWVGNWQTGQKWKVTDRLSSIGVVAIRPDK